MVFVGPSRPSGRILYAGLSEESLDMMTYGSRTHLGVSLPWARQRKFLTNTLSPGSNGSAILFLLYLFWSLACLSLEHFNTASYACSSVWWCAWTHPPCWLVCGGVGAAINGGENLHVGS